MAQVKLSWTRLALADLSHAHDYIALESPSAAAATIERIQSALAAVCRHPQLGRPGRLAGTRELVIPRTPFIAAYRIKAGRIEVLAVIHTARSWPDAL